VQKTIIDRILTTFETGRPHGNYGGVAIFNDGPHGIRQLTYGRCRATEYGKLRLLVRRYAEAGGMFSEDLSRYEDRIGTFALTDDPQFRSLLRAAGRTDPVMRDMQDAFFEKQFFDPAMQWATDHGLTLPLSALVVYDSFIHSGSILPLLRHSFPEQTPDTGGDERTWTTAYVKARHTWLAAHARVAVRKTQFRTRCLAEQIQRANWHLELRPIRAKTVVIR
jgi:chitosanase